MSEIHIGSLKNYLPRRNMFYSLSAAECKLYRLLYLTNCTDVRHLEGVGNCSWYILSIGIDY